MTCKHDGPDYCLRGYLKRNAGPGCPRYEGLKLYICGRITGDADYQAKFLDAENKLYEAGFRPVNPAARVPADTDWNQAMREAISLMLQCDGVALLPDWKESRGAKIEVRLSIDLDITFMSVDRWLTELFPARHNR
jgi:hypothetical protein